MGIYKFKPQDAVDFSIAQGIRIISAYGSELKFERCPYCKNKTDDKNTFAINKDTGAFNCKRASCGAKGNMLTLARDFGFSLGRDVDEYYNRQRRFRDISKYPRPITKTPAVEYLEGRGISKMIAESYAITVKPDDDKVLVIPFYDDKNILQMVKYRRTDFNKDIHSNKEWSLANTRPILFGMDHCDPERSKTLVMTEGQLDALSVAEAFSGNINAVSVPTGANGFTWVPYCWDFLCRYDTLIVFGDCEKGRITLLEDMRIRFTHGTVKHVRKEAYKDCKDANDLLRRYGKRAVVEAVQTAEILKNPRIKKLSEVKKVNMSEMESISTGLAGLDEKLGGFYFGQLIVLTGERGHGKSTLGSQFLTRAIDQNMPTFCYSGELPDFYFQDWFDRQCAGPDYINPKMTERGFKEYIVNGDLIDQIHRWYDELFYIYDNSIVEADGAENETVLQTVESAIRQYGCRVLMIDNLMTAISDDLRSDLYRQQSAFVRRLAEMAKQYHAIIILVVHPRKKQLQKFDNDDVSGSSNITNLADVVLNYVKAKDNEESEADSWVQITKNRFGGITDYSGIPLYYEPASKRISEGRHIFSWVLGWNVEAQNASDGFEQADDDEEVPF